MAIGLKALPLRHPVAHLERRRYEVELADAMESAFRRMFAALRKRIHEEAERRPYPSPAPAWAKALKSYKDVWDIFLDDEFWAEQEEMAKQGITPLARRIMLGGVETGEALGGYAIDMDAVNEDVLRFTRSYTDKWWKQLEKVRRRNLRQALITWQEEGLGTRGLPDLIDALQPLFGRASAERVAVTETTRLFAEGNLAAWREMEGITRVQWATAEDELVCPICEPLNGKVWLKNRVPLVPPAHVNCLLPGNEVMPLGLQAAMRAWYDGPALELVTEFGAKLAVTPNHPILTPQGFVAAKLLKVGDHVVYATDVQGIAAAIDPDDKHRPALIEEVWDSLAMQRRMVRRSMPVASEDLHGEGRFCDGDIDIVWADGFLLDNASDASATQGGGQSKLYSNGVRQDMLVSFGPLDLFGQCMHPSRSGCVSGSGLGLALGDGHPLPLEFFGLRLSSRPNAMLDEPAPYARAGDIVSRRQGVLAFPSKIAGDHFIFGDGLAVAPNWDSSSAQGSIEGSRGYAKITEEFLDRFASEVATQKIVKIRDFHFSGHVYDLQCLAQVYIASGMVVKNCRCSLLPVERGARIAKRPEPEEGE